jgi:hypothetical protein
MLLMGLEELRKEKIHLNVGKAGQLPKGEVRDLMHWPVGLL